MTAHSCTSFDPTCYRCELGRDEAAIVPSGDNQPAAAAPVPMCDHICLKHIDAARDAERRLSDLSEPDENGSDREPQP